MYLLPAPYTLLPETGGLLSVALALRLLWPSVRWSPVLRAARTFLSWQCHQQLPVAPEGGLYHKNPNSTTAKRSKVLFCP